MKIGKVSESILKRSVLKYIKPNNECVQKGAAVGADCALFNKADKMTAVSTASVWGQKNNLAAAHAILRAVNNLAAGNAVPYAVQLHIMLPERYREIALKRMMEAAAETAATNHITISGGHTEVIPDIQAPIVSATALGYAENEFVKSAVEPGQEIVMTKWIGISETAYLAKEKEEELARKKKEREEEAARRKKEKEEEEARKKKEKAAERRKAQIERTLISTGGQILKRGLLKTLFK